MTKTALITGCSSGIGRATAHELLEADWTVYATAREERDLGALADRGAATATLDVTSEADVRAVVESVAAEEDRIDCLVNNAGYGQFGPVEDVATELVERQFDVNVFGPHRLVRAVLPHMRSRGSGRIVNVSSVDDRVVLPGIGVYSGSKFALRAISDALRQELFGSGVGVVVVEPGLVATEFFDRAVAEVARLDRSAAYADIYGLLDRLDRIGRGVPLVSEPRAVARTIREAATVEDPDAYYRVGTLSKVGTAASSVVTGRHRDRLTRSGVSLLSRDWLLRRVSSGPRAGGD